MSEINVMRIFVILAIVMIVSNVDGHPYRRAVRKGHDFRLKRLRRSFLGGLMFPGTKWCGKGNRATSYNDLGEKKELDKCCRKHDHCPASIPSAATKYGLHNDDIYTRSHCDCDDEFRDCLKNLHTSAANDVGGIFFNFIRVKCFKCNLTPNGSTGSAGTTCANGHLSFFINRKF